MEEETNIALFMKDDMFALLAMAATEEGAAILSFDPRDPNPKIAVFDNYFKAIGTFDKAIQGSIEQGWKCFHKGAPNWG